MSGGAGRGGTAGAKGGRARARESYGLCVHQRRAWVARVESSRERCVAISRFLWAPVFGRRGGGRRGWWLGAAAVGGRGMSLSVGDTCWMRLS